MGQGMGRDERYGDMQGLWDGTWGGMDGTCGTWGYGVGRADMGWDRGWNVWEHMGGYGMGCRMGMGWDGMRDLGTCRGMGWDVGGYGWDMWDMGVWDGMWGHGMGQGMGCVGTRGELWDGMQDGTGDGMG